MREFLIAFRSRAEAMRFYESLAGYRLPSKLIHTPSSVGIGCGLSVKMFTKELTRAMQILQRGNYNSVAGAYYIDRNGDIVRI